MTLGAISLASAVGLRYRRTSAVTHTQEQAGELFPGVCLPASGTNIR